MVRPAPPSPAGAAAARALTYGRRDLKIRQPSGGRFTVAARALTYWRDPRYFTSAAGLLLVPLALRLATLTGRSGGLSLAMASLAGYLMGWSMDNAIAYHGTTFWTHAATGVSGPADHRPKDADRRGGFGSAARLRDSRLRAQADGSCGRRSVCLFERGD